MWLWILAASAAPCLQEPEVGEDHTCATSALMHFAHTADPACVDAFLQRARLGRRASAPWPSPGELTDKSIRNVYDSPHLLETDNFAIWWGDQAEVAAASTESLGEWFEASRSAQLALGFPAPRGTDTHKFNVYVGGTGAGPDDLAQAGGYFYWDSEGHPLIVIDVGSLHAGYGRVTVAHEHFHAVQDAVGTYEYAGTAAWYHEATANWVVPHVFADDLGHAWSLPGLAYRPELPLAFFRYPETGDVEELHQYGAFLFPVFLEERVGVDLIRRSWVQAGWNEDPLRAIDRLLVEEGFEGGVREAFYGFALANATWDYEQGGLYEEMFDGYLDVYDSHRPSGQPRVPTGWIEASEHLPRSYGANYWKLEGVPSEVTVRFSGEPGPDWLAAIVARTAETHRVERLDLVDGVGEARITELDHADEVWFVSAVTRSTQPVPRPFSYGFEVDGEPVSTGPIVQPEPNKEAMRGCGCGSTVPTMPAVGVLLLLWVTGSRRFRS